jgi:hypothetical protein
MRLKNLLPPSQFRGRRRRLSRWVGIASAILFFVGLVIEHARAQAIEPVFRVGDTEFLIGGWNLAQTSSNAGLTHAARIDSSFAWARALGATIFRMRYDIGWNAVDTFDYYNALLDAADTTNDMRFFITGIEPLEHASYGREAKFYLVPDSVPFKDWKCKFLYLNGGRSVENLTQEDDWENPAMERVYHRDSVTWGQTIADSIVLDWRPERTAWWSQTYNGIYWCRVHEPQQLRPRERMFGEYWSLHDKGSPHWSDTHYVAVTGHLIQDELEHPDSSILWIDLFYDIGRGDEFVHPVNGVQSATQNRTEYCTTLTVRERDLDRALSTDAWDKYRTVSIKFSAAHCNQNVQGPTFPGTESRRLNMRVRYAGNASVALRSIAIRDSIANVVLAGGEATDTLRNRILRSVAKAIKRRSTGALHASVIGIAPDGEQSPIQVACVREVNRWLQEAYYAVPDPLNNRNDTLTVWLEGLHREAAHHQVTIGEGHGRLTMVTPEFSSIQDRREWTNAWEAYGDTAGRAAIREHNGGRYQLPELRLDSVKIEQLERQVQTRHFCQYLPDAPASFKFQNNVARSARIARDLNRRLVAIPFVSTNFWIRRRNDLSIVGNDSAIGCDRIMEPAEIRNIANMSLVMGAKGIFWQVLSHHMNFMELDTPSNVWHGLLLDYPIAGGGTGDTTQNHLVDMPITNRLRDTTLFTMPDSFWTGWQIRSRAVRHYNAWLKRVGAELMRLKWRDAYSIHAQRSVRYRRSFEEGCDSNLYWHNYLDSTTPRPLPSNEIINRVTTRTLAGRLDTIRSRTSSSASSTRRPDSDTIPH